MKSALKDTAQDLMNAAIQNKWISAAPGIASFGIGVGSSLFGYYLAEKKENPPIVILFFLILMIE
jgi:hypothetical protein